MINRVLRLFLFLSLIAFFILEGKSAPMLYRHVRSDVVKVSYDHLEKSEKINEMVYDSLLGITNKTSTKNHKKHIRGPRGREKLREEVLRAFDKNQFKEFGKSVRNHTFSYRDSILATSPDSLTTRNYTKIKYNLARRNAFTLTIPRMYEAMRGKEREYFCEIYSTLHVGKLMNSFEERRHVYVSTIHRNRHALDNILDFLNPVIYNETIFKDFLLSPFFGFNKIYYRYKYSSVNEEVIRIDFSPIRANTQLVKGYALVDITTGRILSYEFKGMYDMVHFTINVEQGEKGLESLMPKICTIQAKITYLGSKIYTNVKTMNGCKRRLSDKVRDREDAVLMKKIRPIPLTKDEQAIVEKYITKPDAGERGYRAMTRDTTLMDSVMRHRYDSLMAVAETMPKPKRNWAKYIFWDIIGDNMLHDISTDFGDNRKGSLRFGPLFNPLYFGYSKSKGIVYKMQLNAEYNTTDNSSISVGFKGGYAFKERRFYFYVPLRYTFNKRHNGYISMTIEKGNPITNSAVLDQVKQEHQADKEKPIDFDKMQLDYFKNTTYKFVANYEVNPYFGFQVGANYYRRSAVARQDFISVGKPVVYRTLAPVAQLQYRPWGPKGPYFTADYEIGLKGIMKADAAYQKWEFDTSYLMKLQGMRSWSLRGGFGFYTTKSKNHYFLDYKNFHQDYLPGGWNDDWSGNFELLRSEWYNASNYYIRANSTYEAPLLILSWLPWVGRLIQKERIYLSALAIRHYFPYLECGYGFTNNIFSVGFFTGFTTKHFEGVGFRFGLELFENW